MGAAQSQRERVGLTSGEGKAGSDREEERKKDQCRGIGGGDGRETGVRKRELYLERGSGWHGVKGRFPGQT